MPILIAMIVVAFAVGGYVATSPDNYYNKTKRECAAKGGAMVFTKHGPDYCIKKEAVL